MATQVELRQALQHKVFAHPSISRFNSYSKNVFAKLSHCHTHRIGMHQYKCNNAQCGTMHYSYHSCGNRHCPNCGTMRKVQWIENRMSELLPTSYYHIVFTLPQELRKVAMAARKPVLALLFQSAHHTLLKLGADPRWLGAKPGIVSVLHTWGQDLTWHPHVHCIVSGGGINDAQQWVPAKRKNNNFIFPRRAMEKIYKAHFLKHIQALLHANQLGKINVSEVQASIHQAQQKDWNVYAKAPFGGPEMVIKYLGRYTHKTAITTHRIMDITDTHVSFSYKDYADNHAHKQMTLTIEEFLRRFEQHILPKGFVRIRHAGYLSPRGKTKRVEGVLKQLSMPSPMPCVTVPVYITMMQLTGKDITQCPECKTGKLELIATFKYFNNRLVNICELRNRGSPPKATLHKHENKN